MSMQILVLIVQNTFPNSLTLVLLYMVPLVLLSAVLLAFVKEVLLATTIDRGENTDTLTVLGEGVTARK